MEQKTVFITGGTSGIGKALAFVFAEKGFRVALNGRNAERVEQTKTELKDAGFEALCLVGDVSNQEDVRQNVAEIIDNFGRLDTLICNAGISMRALVEDLDTEVIRKVMDVNFWGTVYAVKCCLPYLLKSKGVVVGVSSIAGLKGLPARSGYAASKFAIHGFLECLRVENRKKGLSVFIFAPWFTGTNIRKTALTASGAPQGKTPRDEGKMVTAQQAALAIYRGVKKRKRLKVHTLKGKLMIFLHRLFPAFMDKVVYNQMAKEPDSPFR